MTAKNIILSSAGLKNVIPRVDSGDEIEFYLWKSQDETE